MKIIKFLLFFGIILFVSCNTLAQNKQIFVAMDDLPQSAIKALTNNRNVKELKIIYGDFIYKKGNKLIEEIFIKELTRLFPLNNSSGYVMLDWEGQLYYDLIGNGVSITKKSNAASEFIKAIRIINNIRPNLKVGVYGLPNPRFDNYDQNSKKYLGEIFKYCDFIVPVFYLDNPNDEFDGQLKAYSNFIYGQNISKPVYPIVWDRYSTTDGKYRSQQTGSTKFVRTTKKLLQNKNFSGIIYWGRDSHFFGVEKAKNKMISNENLHLQYKNRIINNTKNILK